LSEFNFNGGCVNILRFCFYAVRSDFSFQSFWLHNRYYILVLVLYLPYGYLGALYLIVKTPGIPERFHNLCQ
jgi:hypothetical protein